uniref:Uncharacterized protein n=1 Tax=Peronospora matthiolae TaxID=2874970 RepID=A0AAV1V269_9STRA
MESRGIANMINEILKCLQARTVIPTGIGNSAAILLVCKPAHSRKTRHIELRGHYVRERIKAGNIMVKIVAGAENPADTFTKGLPNRSLSSVEPLLAMRAS